MKKVNGVAVIVRGHILGVRRDLGYLEQLWRIKLVHIAITVLVCERAITQCVLATIRLVRVRTTGDH